MTQRIPPINPADAAGKVRGLFDMLTVQLGGVPNIFRTIAQSPAVLKGFLCFNDALAEGALDAMLRNAAICRLIAPQLWLHIAAFRCIWCWHDTCMLLFIEHLKAKEQIDASFK